MEFQNVSISDLIEHSKELLTDQRSQAIAATLLLLVCALVVWRIFRRRPVTEDSVNEADAESLSGLTRTSRYFGFAIIIFFLGGFTLWSITAPLASAALAPGVVSPDGARKTVQHLEGGIIRRIHVREGDTVAKGAPLVTLEDIRAKARFEELRERMLQSLAVEARLEAEQADADQIEFPQALFEAGEERVRVAVATQRSLFESRRETQAARESILRQRIAQLLEEITGLEEVIAAQEEQLSLIGREIEGAQKLYDKGLERLPRLLALQREQADIKAERATNKAGIARNKQSIGETELQLLATRQQVEEAASAELAETRAELATLRSQIPERADQLARTSVTAPIAGRVLNIQVTTEAGGVLRSGDPILDIVPDEASLIIDARVRPQDIESVAPGMKARVVLTAYNQRNMPQIHGDVRSISADRLIDERTGEPYFLGKIVVDPDDLANVPGGVDLVAGMPADVMILTGQRTFMDFLAKPFIDSIRLSFREN